MLHRREGARGLGSMNQKAGDMRGLVGTIIERAFGGRQTERRGRGPC